MNSANQNRIKIRFKKQNVFNSVYFPFLYDTTPLQIMYGGASSGKSHFLAQREVITCMQEGRNWLVLRQYATDLRGSIYNEVCDVIREWGLSHLFRVLEGRLVVECITNGAQIVFHGLDDLEKVKSIKPKRGVFEAIHIEEATQISERSFADIGWRLRGASELQKFIVLTFNPIYREHWIARTIFNGKKPALGKTLTLAKGRTLILRTHYKHNRFLSSDDIERIESYKHDKYRWPVYGMGEWGTMGDVLFTNWTTEDLSEREFDHWHNGLDFGWAPDPAALVHCAKRGKRIYVCSGVYVNGLTNPQLAEEIKPIIGRDLVWCDSAEPKSIAELCHCGITASAVSKGKDSVWHGIQWLQQHELIIDESLQWLVNELSIYKLQEDKLGNAIPKKPVDKHNHGIDALRYAFENEMDMGDIPFLYTGRKREEPKHEDEIVVL